MAVALIGAGVDYRRPEILARLARDGEGEAVAWDTIDEDAQPLEREPAAPRVACRDAGTAMAGIVLAEAGATSLVPVRVPADDPIAFARAVAFVARTPARVAGAFVPTPAKDQWQPLADLLRAVRQILLIVPAGHSGGDLDLGPRAPAWLGLDNVLTVTASGPDGLVPNAATWGAKRVDVAVPVEADTPTTPSALENTAVARATALAARIAVVEPDLAGAALKARILSYARPSPPGSMRPTRAGWIADAARINRLE